MNLIQLYLVLRLMMSPLLVLTALLIIVSAMKMWRNFHLNKILCFTIFMIGLSLLVMGVADFITNQARTLLLTS